MKTLIIAFVTGILVMTNLMAQSDVNHRYNIRGYVLDDNRQGISNQEVKVYRNRLMLESVVTNSDGYYSLNLKLRNSDNQQLLRLKTATNEAEIRVSFDEKEQSPLTVHLANFVADKFKEGELSSTGFPYWIFPLAGLLALGFLAVKLEKRRKKKIQLKKDRLSGRSSEPHHKPKKKRRKNR